MHDNKGFASVLSRIFVVIAVAIVATTTVAAAESPDWYAGLGFGQTKAQDIVCDLDITCSADDTDTGWKVFGGYRFSPNAAIEFGYVDLGEVTFEGEDSFLGVTKLSIEAQGFNAALTGFLPVGGSTSLMGKIGLFRWDVDARASASFFGSGSESETGIDLMFGFGVSVDVTRNAAVRLEWERFGNVGDENVTGESDVDLLSASFAYRFR
ncbi:outer membrane protein A [Sulfurifustis variabilis]|uniref:Outer membrane protein A n=1 Tax=Sulfurifustis variabilis TaxID=1675686 RepID=A0A1B4V0D5_9GAMM|nr:outer membrane beta-barrel protein [Sulfurifustis variabilis]BAU46733.1 outer membrane protein A [Sulfurifustis variabilis]